MAETFEEILNKLRNNDSGLKKIELNNKFDNSHIGINNLCDALKKK